MATYITTLKDATNTNGLLPKTVLKAVADDNGDYLDSNLTVSDINALKGGAFSSSVRHANEVPGTPVQLNADQLNGHADSYFATEAEVSKVRGNTQNYNPSSEYDTGDFAVKEGVLYRCLEDNVTGVFDNTKWEVVDLVELKDSILALNTVNREIYSSSELMLNSTYIGTNSSVRVVRFGNLIFMYCVLEIKAAIPTNTVAITLTDYFPKSTAYDFGIFTRANSDAVYMSIGTRWSINTNGEIKTETSIGSSGSNARYDSVMFIYNV